MKNMIVLFNEDCFDTFKDIKEHSVHAVISDLPYGMTACKWDSILPIETLWSNYKRLITTNGVIILTASQPFTSILVSSNYAWFKHEWIWQKASGSNFATLKYQPLKEHESVLVFSPGTPRYYPILQSRKGTGASRAKYPKIHYTHQKNESQGTGLKEDTKKTYNPELRNPSSVQFFNNRLPEDRGDHPTQKPVALMEYLIKTYTKEGDTVLDNCMGSGTTGVACVNTDRNFIGIEKEVKYFNKAQERILRAKTSKSLLE